MVWFGLVGNSNATTTDLRTCSFESHAKKLFKFIWTMLPYSIFVLHSTRETQRGEWEKKKNSETKQNIVNFSLNRQQRLMRKSFEYSEFMVNVITCKQESLLYGEALTFCRRHSIELSFIRRCNFQETTRTRTINGFYSYFLLDLVAANTFWSVILWKNFYCRLVGRLISI